MYNIVKNTNKTSTAEEVKYDLKSALGTQHVDLITKEWTGEPDVPSLPGSPTSLTPLSQLWCDIGSLSGIYNLDTHLCLWV